MAAEAELNSPECGVFKRERVLSAPVTSAHHPRVPGPGRLYILSLCFDAKLPVCWWNMNPLPAIEPTCQ